MAKALTYEQKVEKIRLAEARKEAKRREKALTKQKLQINERKASKSRDLGKRQLKRALRKLL